MASSPTGKDADVSPPKEAHCGYHVGNGLWKMLEKLDNETKPTNMKRYATLIVREMVKSSTGTDVLMEMFAKEADTEKEKIYGNMIEEINEKREMEEKRREMEEKRKIREMEEKWKR